MATSLLIKRLIYLILGASLLLLPALGCSVYDVGGRPSEDCSSTVQILHNGVTPSGLIVIADGQDHVVNFEIKNLDPSRVAYVCISADSKIASISDIGEGTCFPVYPRETLKYPVTFHASSPTSGYLSFTWTGGSLTIPVSASDSSAQSLLFSAANSPLVFPFLILISTLLLATYLYYGRGWSKARSAGVAVVGVLLFAVALVSMIPISGAYFYEYVDISLYPNNSYSSRITVRQGESFSGTYVVKTTRGSRILLANFAELFGYNYPYSSSEQKSVKITPSRSGIVYVYNETGYAQNYQGRLYLYVDEWSNVDVACVKVPQVSNATIKFDVSAYENHHYYFSIVSQSTISSNTPGVVQDDSRHLHGSGTGSFSVTVDVHGTGDVAMCIQPNFQIYPVDAVYIVNSIEVSAMTPMKADLYNPFIQIPPGISCNKERQYCSSTECRGTFTCTVLANMSPGTYVAHPMYTIIYSPLSPSYYPELSSSGTSGIHIDYDSTLEIVVERAGPPPASSITLSNVKQTPDDTAITGKVTANGDFDYIKVSTPEDTEIIRPSDCSVSNNTYTCTFKVDARPGSNTVTAKLYVDSSLKDTKSTTVSVVGPSVSITSVTYDEDNHKLMINLSLSGGFRYLKVYVDGSSVLNKSHSDISSSVLNNYGYSLSRYLSLDPGSHTVKVTLTSSYQSVSDTSTVYVSPTAGGGGEQQPPEQPLSVSLDMSVHPTAIEASGPEDLVTKSITATVSYSVSGGSATLVVRVNGITVYNRDVSGYSSATVTINGDKLSCGTNTIEASLADKVVTRTVAVACRSLNIISPANGSPLELPSPDGQSVSPDAKISVCLGGQGITSATVTVNGKTAHQVSPAPGCTLSYEISVAELGGLSCGSSVSISASASGMTATSNVTVSCTTSPVLMVNLPERIKKVLPAALPSADLPVKMKPHGIDRFIIEIEVDGNTIAVLDNTAKDVNGNINYKIELKRGSHHVSFKLKDPSTGTVLDTKESEVNIIGFRFKPRLYEDRVELTVLEDTPEECYVSYGSREVKMTLSGSKYTAPREGDTGTIYCKYEGAIIYQRPFKGRFIFPVHPDKAKIFGTQYGFTVVGTDESLDMIYDISFNNGNIIIEGDFDGVKYYQATVMEADAGDISAIVSGTPDAQFSPVGGVVTAPLRPGVYEVWRQRSPYTASYLVIYFAQEQPPPEQAQPGVEVSLELSGIDYLILVVSFAILLTIILVWFKG